MLSRAAKTVKAAKTVMKATPLKLNPPFSDILTGTESEPETRTVGTALFQEPKPEPCHSLKLYLKCAQRPFPRGGETLKGLYLRGFFQNTG